MMLLKKWKIISLVLLLCLPVTITLHTHKAYASSVNMVDAHVASVYNQIDFSKSDTLSFEAFKYAYTGYLNLLQQDKISKRKPILTVCDMSLSSTVNRMWVIDLEQKTVLLNTYVAHGQGSGEEFAFAFSNKKDSHQSSLGFYVTGNTYTGEHGNSLYLYGMDKGYNSAAYERNIVLHGADYVCKDFISSNKKLGRSWGCPAVSSKLSDKTIDLIKDGTCLFVYYPAKKYLAASRWLKGMDYLPEDLPTNQWQFASGKQPAADIKVIYEFGPMTKQAMIAGTMIRFPLF